MSDCIFMISVNFIKKISKTTIIIDGPSCLNTLLKKKKHMGRLVLAYGPTFPRAEFSGTHIEQYYKTIIRSELSLTYRPTCPRLRVLSAG